MCCQHAPLNANVPSAHKLNVRYQIVNDEEIHSHLGICQYFMSTTLLVAGNSKTGGWHLAQLAIEEARAKEHKRQSGQMRKCERHVIMRL